MTETAISLTQGNITFFIAIAAIMFNVYHFFRNPAVKADQRLVLLEKALSALTKEFSEFKNNEMRVLQTKFDSQQNQINNISNSMVEVKTIINERIPAKPYSEAFGRRLDDKI